jgi:hypothetical protein
MVSVRSSSPAVSVDENFEAEINVLEGEYGVFLSESQLKDEKVIEYDKVVFNDVFRWIENPK